VDGFRVKTDPTVSRGMEIFMRNKDVLPNLFATVPEVGYRIVGPSLNPFFFDETYATAQDYIDLTLTDMENPDTEAKTDSTLNFIHEKSTVSASTIVEKK